jgi:hypothetical protein
LSNFDDDVSRRIQHLRVEKIEADERQRRALDAKHAQYAEPADLIQKTLGQSPFEVGGLGTRMSPQVLVRGP